MTELINILVSTVVPAIIAGAISLWLGRKQGESIQVDIEGKYQQMLSKEIDERKKLSDRLNALEAELRRYMRAYDYSIRHIRKIDPQSAVPNFLDWSTDELKAYYKSRYGDNNA